mmetsp:Transcript_37706/g.64332  ORF Transcript_37706/g.64332 Transcript_37706/m.64332 type:complete len:302 (+) Transcript_37706:226-1131(+)
MDLHVPINANALILGAAEGKTTKVVRTGIDAQVDVANLAFASEALETGADAVASTGGLIRGVVARQSFGAFGGEVDPFAFKATGMVFALMEGFSRGIAISPITIKRDTPILSIPPLPPKSYLLLHKLCFAAFLILVFLILIFISLLIPLLPSLLDNLRPRSAKGIVIVRFHDIVSPLPADVDLIDPVAFLGERAQILLADLTVIVRDLGASAWILLVLLLPQPSMGVIGMIGILGYCRINETSAFVEFLVGQFFQFEDVGYGLEGHDLSRGLTLDGATRALGDSVLGEYSRGPRGTKITDG